MNVFSSNANLFNFSREGISLDGLMKRYALLFDSVIFNRMGASIGKGELYSTLGQFLAGFTKENEDYKQRLELGKNPKFSSIFVDCWDVVDDAEAFESRRTKLINKDMASQISDFCFNEIRRVNGLKSDSYKFDIDDVNELASDLYVDLGLGALLEVEGIEAVPSYSPIVGRALSAESAKQGAPVHSILDNDLLVPDVSNIDWNTILELRDDRYAKAFRRLITEKMAVGGDVEQALVNQVQSDMWSLIKDIQPNTRQTYLEVLGSNLPSPIIMNPIGLAAGLRDVYQSHRRDDRYGHVFFIQKMRTESK